MKAIAITQAAADGNNIPSLTEIDLPVPTAHGRDLLVAVKAHLGQSGRHQSARRLPGRHTAGAGLGRRWRGAVRR